MTWSACTLASVCPALMVPTVLSMWMSVPVDPVKMERCAATW